MNESSSSGPQWEFAPHGECGTEVSDAVPAPGGVRRRHRVDPLDAHVATRTTTTPRSACTPARSRFARPSIGSWVSYGLGTTNRNLPSFVVHRAASSPTPARRSRPATSCPARIRARCVVPGAEPVANIAPRVPSHRQAVGAGRARRSSTQRTWPPRGRTIRCWRPHPVVRDRLRHADGRARGVRPRSREPTPRSQLYGLERGQTDGFAWQCLVARRLVERGVRFVELIDTGSSQQLGLARRHGRPRPAGRRTSTSRSPACLRDLKQRGMLDETLVVWTTEFGRTPFNNTADAKGREHHTGRSAPGWPAPA